MKLIIDGKNIDVKEGKTVLEAALENRIYIPNLCYHPDLEPLATCRLCVVEIEGSKGLQTACATKIREGIKVFTNTIKIINHRKNLIWLFLSEHPKEIADSQFKKVVEFVGVNNLLSDYVSKKDLPVFSEDPLFTRDLNRCVLCGRCARICQEVRGVGSIGYISRGIKTVIGACNNEPLKDAACKFCRACVEVCPSGALKDKKIFDQDNRNKILLPCTNNCPVKIDVPRYVKLIAEGRFQDSVEVNREKVPFPHILGCVCHHPCEFDCTRNDLNASISIRELKRFVAEKDNRRWKSKIKIKETGKKAAIIGSGPAGLTAAWFLRLKGHSVTVYEKLPKVGGMLRVGIPEYRLPRKILDKEIKDIVDIGVEIKANSEISSLENLKNFDAIFLASGAHEGMRTMIEGENNPGVLDGISLLRKISLGEEVDISGTVAIIGGGNVAIDIARSSLRLGSKKVLILYRRTRAEMPAYKEEIEQALEEGVEIMYLTNPKKIMPGIKVECLKMILGEPDESGRRSPIPIKGSEFILEVDKLIIAIGQKIHENFSLNTDINGRIIADKNNYCKENIFAGGDLVTGPASVIEAIESARIAASSIDKYFGGNGVIDQKYIPDEIDNPFIGREEGFADKNREKIKILPVEKRLKGFSQVELGFNEKSAIKESERCLKCQLRLNMSKTNNAALTYLIS